MLLFPNHFLLCWDSPHDKSLCHHSPHYHSHAIVTNLITHHLTVPNSISSSTITPYVRPLSFPVLYQSGIMDSSLCENILSKVATNIGWKQSSFMPHDKNRFELSCAFGSHALTLVNSTYQSRSYQMLVKSLTCYLYNDLEWFKIQRYYEGVSIMESDVNNDFLLITALDSFQKWLESFSHW